MTASRRWTLLVPAASALALALLASCSLLKKGMGPPPAVLAKAQGADPVGSAACFDCHDDESEIGFAHTVHGELDLGSEPGSLMCEACHGPAGNHIETYDPADIFGKEDLAALGNEERSRICLSCHKTLAASWEASSPHAGRELSCWSCHADVLHGEASKAVEPLAVKQDMLAADGGKFCLQCHTDVEQDFLMQYRHPVGQGGVQCTSCHGPHGETGKVETSVALADVCSSCHPQVEGPFIYEHDAMFEGCDACHTPHGSPNPKLLVQTGNGLCLQCHVEALFPLINGQNHDVHLGAGAECYQCHTDVHGSNMSEVLGPGL